MEEKEVPMYRLPFYRALSEQALLLGAPKKALVFNVLIALLFLIDFHFWQILPVSLLFHFGCIYIAQSDEQFFEALQNYRTKKKYYCT